MDSDLTFTENWLKKAVDVLKKEEIGAVALVDYRKYDPKDLRFQNVTKKGNYLESDNFVSSGYGFRKEVFDKHGGQMKHDGWHKYLHRIGYKLAIVDVAENHGFGKDTVYVDLKTGKAVKMDHKQLTYA